MKSSESAATQRAAKPAAGSPASYLEHLFESAPEAITVLDGKGRVVRVNREFTRMFGYEPQEVLGEPIHSLILPDDRSEERSLLRDSLQAGRSVNLETKRRRKDGTLVDVSLLATPVSGAGDVASHVIFRDISDRKQADALQAALYRIAEKASSAEDLQDLYAAIHGILAELMYAKNCYIALWDRESDMVSFPYFVDEKDPPFPPHKFRRGLTEYVLRSGQPLLATPDALDELVHRGEVARAGAPSLDWMGVPLKLGDVTFGCLTVQSYEPKIRYGEKEKEILTFVSRQIASAIEHKRNQDAIRQSESKFRALAESASQAIYIFDNKRFLYVNPATERIFGYTREELLFMEDAWSLVSPEYRERARQQAVALSSGGAPVRFEFSILTKDEKTRWLDFSASSIEFGGKPAAVATAVDVTDRKRAEQLQRALYRIADETSTARDLANLYAALHSIVGELMYAKNFYIALYDETSSTIAFPYAVDEVDEYPSGRVPVGKGLTEYVLHTGQPLLATPERFYELLGKGDIEVVGTPAVDWLGVPLMKGDVSFGVLAVQSYDKAVRFGESEKNILTFVSQHVASAIEQKRNQDAVRASEARYRSLVQSAVYGIYQSSLEERFIHVNPALVAMLGFGSDSEVLRLDLAKDIYTEPAQRKKIVETLAQTGRLDGVEAQWRRKDGTRCIVRLSGRTIEGSDGKPSGFEMIAEDVTERRHLEDQLRQSQRMEAVGQLAGGVAHDFNNLLTVVKGNCDLLLDDLPAQDLRRSEVEEIQRASNRAAALTQQLLAFSRKQVLAPKVVSLNSVVGNMERLLRRLLGEHIDLMVDLRDNLGSVKADPGQLEQVIMNLALNARDAMLNGGKLAIETANVDFDERSVRDRMELRPGRYVMLAVSDNGVGIDPETLTHIFEPFFTTKRLGEGTGLGLSTVYGIIKQSDGHVMVYSEVGHGTTFKVYLPRVEQKEESGDHNEVAVETRKGNETVLVVEDEEGVRSLIRQVLRRNGYTVLEASSGGEALEICEKGAKINLLLTDVILPQMSGRELAERVTRQHPGVKLLFMSGYTGDAILQHGALDANTPFLQKPFNTQALSRKVREVLDS